ncbi:FAD-binding oxidoreductase [Actinomadura atramentaria]|uniref:FAD-binding oxidoreductase n=1 Tax=Actinomadura atramentaria TaxID=1990 RepID=UPI00036BEDEB|nr:FAD-binding oxidoreductase [Actinomadura atramentaria]
MSSATPGREAPAWRTATLVGDRCETPDVRTLLLDVPGWPGHLPGQHVDLRLTADDGYQATRSYSIAAPAAGERVELTVQRLPDGEVSPYLVDDYPTGALIEMLGPVGGWFVWRGGDEPLLLVAGGAGVVPVMAMARAWRDTGSRAPLRLLYSLRSPDQLFYADELADLAERGAGVLLAYTRETPPGHDRPAARLAADDLAAHGFPPGDAPHCYVCGPTPFVEAVGAALTGLGHDGDRVRAERFGPTGG